MPIRFPVIADLVRLDLSRNNLSRIPDLRPLSRLESLDLSNNQLRQPGLQDVVAMLPAFRSLKRLSLVMNPITMDDYSMLYIGLLGSSLPAFALELGEPERFFVQWRTDAAKRWDSWFDVAPYGLFISNQKDDRKQVVARLAELELKVNRRLKEFTLILTKHNIAVTFVPHETKETRKFSEVSKRLHDLLGKLCDSPKTKKLKHFSPLSRVAA